MVRLSQLRKSGSVDRVAGHRLPPPRPTGWAVLYALVLSLFYKEITLKDMPSIILRSVRTTCIVLLLVATSMGLSWIMSYENIPQDVSRALLSLTENKFAIMIIINRHIIGAQLRPSSDFCL